MSGESPSKTFNAEVMLDGDTGGCWLGLPFDPKEVFGKVRVRLELDAAPREVATPDDLAQALRRIRGAMAAWERLSYTHRREHVEAIEQAKKPETRARRIARAVEMVVGGDRR